MSFFIRNWYSGFWGKHFAKKVDITEEFEWPSRVNIFDIDVYMHVNNASYLRLCEYARWSWAIGTGLADKWRKKQTSPVVTLTSIRYKRQLRLFAKYVIRSKIIHITEKSFYMTQKFYLNDKLACSVLMKLQIIGKSGPVNCIESFKDMYPDIKIPSVKGNQDYEQGLEIFHALESLLLEKPLPALTVTPSPSPAASPETFNETNKKVESSESSNSDNNKNKED